MSDDEPIRMSFRGGQPGGGKQARQVTIWPGGARERGKITNEQVRAAGEFDVVRAEDGRVYKGQKATGALTVEAGSDRVVRRRQGLTARQWKKQRKAARRG